MSLHLGSGDWMAGPAARDLIDRAKQVTGCGSLYRLALWLDIEPYQLQRYYRRNSMPRTAWLLVEWAIRSKEETTNDAPSPTV